LRRAAVEPRPVPRPAADDGEQEGAEDEGRPDRPAEAAQAVRQTQAVAPQVDPAGPAAGEEVAGGDGGQVDGGLLGHPLAHEARRVADGREELRLRGGRCEGEVARGIGRPGQEVGLDRPDDLGGVAGGGNPLLWKTLRSRMRSLTSA